MSLSGRKLIYWVKWQDEPPRRWEFDTIDEFWHRLRDNFLRSPRMLEWIIME